MVRRRRRTRRTPRPGSRLVLTLALAAGCLAGCAPDTGSRADDGVPAGDDARTGAAARAAEPAREDGTTRGDIAFVDAAGQRHVLEEPARRIVSLVPSATETLRALGADTLLVGVTDYDRWPWADSLPSVGGGLEPNLEALVALRPDAVIRFEGEQDPRTPARLDELGIRHVAVRPVSLDDLYETNRIVGALTGRPQAADSLTREIRAGLRRLSEAVGPLPRKRVAFMLGGSPPWVSGPGTYVSEILAVLGAENVFQDLDRPYAAVSPEELRSRDIDVVLVSTEGTYDLSLTPDARVENVGDALDAPGPDVVSGARRVAEAVHGREIR